MLDLRLPMGLMFTIVGVILTVFGAVTYNKPDVYKCSLGINIDLWWGLFLLVFGVAMLGMARMAARSETGEPKK